MLYFIKLWLVVNAEPHERDVCLSSIIWFFSEHFKWCFLWSCQPKAITQIPGHSREHHLYTEFLFFYLKKIKAGLISNIYQKRDKGFHSRRDFNSQPYYKATIVPLSWIVKANWLGWRYALIYILALTCMTLHVLVFHGYYIRYEDQVNRWTTLTLTQFSEPELLQTPFNLCGLNLYGCIFIGLSWPTSTI